MNLPGLGLELRLPTYEQAPAFPWVALAVLAAMASRGEKALIKLPAFAEDAPEALNPKRLPSAEEIRSDASVLNGLDIYDLRTLAPGLGLSSHDTGYISNQKQMRSLLTRTANGTYKPIQLRPLTETEIRGRYKNMITAEREARVPELVKNSREALAYELAHPPLVKLNPTFVGSQHHLFGGSHGEYQQSAEEEAHNERQRRKELFAKLRTLPHKDKAKPKGEQLRMRFSRKKPSLQLPLFGNPGAFYTDEEGEVHPIRASSAYSPLMTYAAQRHLEAVRPDLYKQLVGTGKVHVPAQVERHLNAFEREVNKDYTRETHAGGALRMTRPRWARGWSLEDLGKLADSAHLSTKRRLEDDWFDGIDAEQVIDFRYRHLPRKRSYGLPTRTQRARDYLARVRAR